MLEIAHLPTAVAVCDPATIPDRADFEIMMMAEECCRWLEAFGEYRASLVSPPAIAVWTALVQGEFDLVSDLYERLNVELEARFSGKLG